VPRVGGLTVRGLRGVLVERAGAFAGLPNAFIDGVVLNDVDLDAPEGTWACNATAGTSAAMSLCATSSDMTTDA
jgi:hypothetical protein